MSSAPDVARADLLRGRFVEGGAQADVEPVRRVDVLDDRRRQMVEQVDRGAERRMEVAADHHRHRVARAGAKPVDRIGHLPVLASRHAQRRDAGPVCRRLELQRVRRERHRAGAGDVQQPAG
ncbi:hypothetical protein GIY62_07950 [Burkholderia plantarii]|nr:hypothetical protein GIY62_07950 [Burkholderia plantarii]